MAKRRTTITPEERERWDATTRMLHERIAYHEQKAREEDARRERRRLRWPFRRG
jgi:hypothetical protein